MGDRRVVQVHNRLTTTMSGLGQSLLAASQAHREATGEEANLVRVVIAARLSEKLASVEKLGANLHDFATSQSEQTTGLLLFYPKAALLVFEVNDDHAVALIKHVAICEARSVQTPGKALTSTHRRLTTPLRFYPRSFATADPGCMQRRSRKCQGVAGCPYTAASLFGLWVPRAEHQFKEQRVQDVRCTRGCGRRLPAVGSQDRPVPPSPIHE
eukprot:m.122271 g.122271  ORF g.122271 m.122271 type:complete len:213 (+) comp9625_c0_seq5:2318-2956(+)